MARSKFASLGMLFIALLTSWVASALLWRATGHSGIVWMDVLAASAILGILAWSVVDDTVSLRRRRRTEDGDRLRRDLQAFRSDTALPVLDLLGQISHDHEA